MKVVSWWVGITIVAIVAATLRVPWWLAILMGAMYGVASTLVGLNSGLFK